MKSYWIFYKKYLCLAFCGLYLSYNNLYMYKLIELSRGLILDKLSPIVAHKLEIEEHVVRLNQPRLSWKSIREEVGTAGPAGLRGPHLCTNWSAAARLFYLRGWEGGTRTEGRTNGYTQEWKPDSTAKYQELGPGWLATYDHDVYERLCVLKEAPVSLLSFSYSFLVVFSYSQFQDFGGNKIALSFRRSRGRSFKFGARYDLTMNRNSLRSFVYVFQTVGNLVSL